MSLVGQNLRLPHRNIGHPLHPSEQTFNPLTPDKIGTRSSAVLVCTDCVAGVRGLELQNVILWEPLEYWAKILFNKPKIGDPEPFPPRPCNKDPRKDVSRFESSQPSHGVRSR